MMHFIPGKDVVLYPEKYLATMTKHISSVNSDYHMICSLLIFKKGHVFISSPKFHPTNSQSYSRDESSFSKVSRTHLYIYRDAKHSILSPYWLLVACCLVVEGREGLYVWQ